MSSKEQNEFLLETLGSPRKYGKKKVLIPTIFYSTVSVLGIPGNILTCLTIYKNSYMKTASNFFIFNLAIADLVTLILGKRLFLFAMFPNIYPNIRRYFDEIISS